MPLHRFVRAAGGIYYQATRRTEQEQLIRLSSVIGEHFRDDALRRGVPFPGWESLLGYLTDRAGTEPFLLVLDEFPYLTAGAPALTSILQAQWDHHWQKTCFKLVLSGSHVTAMRGLEGGDQPLYGRRTARLEIEPFDYADAARFLPSYCTEDRLRAYGVFGGLPGHLALLDPEVSLEENVAHHVLAPAGRLLDEAQHMLDAFLADAQVHYSIIEAVANGERTWQGITKRVGREGGSLSRAVHWLMAMGECKWGVVHLSDLRRLQSRTDPILRELSGIRQVHHAVFSGRGVADGVQAEVDSGQVLHFRMVDLYGTEG
jgi:AAA+ ATPase superfamily predicted ATPase